MTHFIFATTRSTLAALLIAFALPASADQHTECYHNGEAYPEGTRIGETVCRDGAWIEE